MPISRKKSCVQCRQAKARCNLASPCSRCSERSIRCNYNDASRPPHEVPIIFPQGTDLPQSESMHLGEIVETEIRDLPFPDYGFMHNFEFSEDIRQAPATLGTDDLGCQTPGWSESNFLYSLDDTHASGTEQMSTLDRPQAHHSQTQSPCRNTGRDEQESDTLAGNSNFVQDAVETTVIYGHVYLNTLSPKKSVSTQSSLLMQVLWGQIKGYPEMMIQGKLPPFIYPPCVLNDVLPKHCVVNGVHQCLPEPLAICASLVSAFRGRTPRSSDFVWKSIYAELERLKNEVIPQPIISP